MYYEPGKTPHGLPHDPFKSCVIPRPIGWISTVDAQGRDNLAPYSQFQNVTFDPPIVMFSANQTTQGERKDSVRNAEQMGQFVWNMATWDLREAVNISAEELPHGVDEFERAGLTKLPSRKVRPARVAGSPIQFECRYLNTLRFPGDGPMGSADVVFGHTVANLVALGQAGMLTPYAPKGMERLNAMYLPKSNPPSWVGMYGWASAICFNTIEAKKRNINLEELNRTGN